MGLAEDVQNCSAESMAIMKDVSALLAAVRKCVDKRRVAQVNLLLPRISYMEKRLSGHHEYISQLMANVETSYKPESDRHIILSGLDAQLAMINNDLLAIDELKESIDELRSTV